MNVTGDLFTTHEGLEQIPMPDAEVYYWRHFLPAEITQTVLQHLIAEIPWRAETIVMWGKRFPLPRLTAWYGDPGTHYTYPGLLLNAMPWTPTLLELKSRVETVVGMAFNSVLLNYYRDHRDSVGFHSDDEWELGDQPIIHDPCHHYRIAQWQSGRVDGKSHRRRVPGRSRVSAPGVSAERVRQTDSRRDSVIPEEVAAGEKRTVSPHQEGTSGYYLG